MPLMDHFQAPLGVYWPWEGFHHAWINTLVRHLNQELLPPKYYALPNIHVGRFAEIDVPTVEGRPGHQEENGGVATAVWAPPRPALTLPVDFGHLDTFEVAIHHEEKGPLLIAAIELVSPANKDRPGQRLAFVTKCASYLQEGIGLIVADVVTNRTINLHVELLRLLNAANDASTSPAMYATAYRTVAATPSCRLEVWLENLTVGGQLPTLPLWLDEDLVIPVDLERTYVDTCEDLRIVVGAV